MTKNTNTQKRLEGQGEELAVRNRELEQQIAVLQQRVMAHAAPLGEARFQMLFDLVPFAVYSCDAQGTIQEYNQRAVELWGRPPAQGDSREKFCGSLKLFYPDGRPLPHQNCPMARVLRGETLAAHEREMLVERPNGQRRHVISHPQLLLTASGEIIEAVNCLYDITEHKQIEARLRAREMELRVITDHVPALIAYIDRELRYQFVNAAYEKTFGCTRQQILGKPVREILGSAYAEVAPHLERTLSGERTVFENRIETPDGLRIMLAEYNADRDEQGQVQGIYAQITDITEREQSLQRERRAHAEAEAASRTKDEFLAMVSHELRAPLNAMLGWTKVLRAGKYQPETLAQALEVIERSARSQQRLIEDLLDSSRIASGKLRLEMQPVDMTAVIEATLDTSRAAAEAKNITLSTKYPAENEVVTGDPERLQQVVWNLTSNAIKFTPNGGSVRLTLERADPYLQLTVSDTGKGIDPEFLPHVFTPFHQADSTSRRHGGLGLGLALVQQIIKLHSGTVSVTSPGVGQGTDFTVRLPLRAVRTTAAVSEVAAARRPVRETAQLLAGLRILVVDDEADARELLALILEHQGAHITRADSAMTAFALLSKAGEGGFDCLVSDIGMPGQDGYELIRRIRASEHTKGLPAIAVTAFGRARDRIAALAAGFQMHIPKPVEPNELTMVIAGLTGRTGKGVSAG